MNKNNTRLHIGAFVAISYLALNFLFDLDIFELFTGALTRMETYELDEVVIAVLIFCPFICAIYKSKDKKTSRQGKN